MKEYKVEKIAKYEALNKVNKEITIESISLFLSLSSLFIFMGLTSFSIVYLFLSFPLAFLEGRSLDSLEKLIKTRRSIIHDDLDNIEIIDNGVCHKIINKGLRK